VTTVQASASTVEVEKAVDEAARAAAEWRAARLEERVHVLRESVRVVVRRADEIAETVSIPNAGPIVIESSNIKNVKQGGRQQVATIAQIQAIKAASNELMIEPAALAAFIDVELGDSPDLSVAKDITEEGKIIMDYLVGLTFEQCGRIVKGLVEAVEKQRNGGA